MIKMFGFGDEFTIESYRIPWLIWIQLLVMILLLVLLYCFSIITLDPSKETAILTTAATKVVAASASTSGLVCDDIQQIEKPAVKHDSTATVVINHRQNTQGTGNPNIKGQIASGTSRRAIDEENADRQGLLLYLHPCHYFNLAKLVFLKCLGLDSTSDTPPNQQRRKRKES